MMRRCYRDFILVNKYTTVSPAGDQSKDRADEQSERGDVMVFRYLLTQPRLHQACDRRAGRCGRIPRQKTDDHGKAIPTTSSGAYSYVVGA